MQNNDIDGDIDNELASVSELCADLIGRIQSRRLGVPAKLVMLSLSKRLELIVELMESRDGSND